MDELSSREFIPFERGVEAGADFVMTGYVSAPEVTGNGEPAVFSGPLTSLLRGVLGFDGVIITDSLRMGAANNAAGAGNAAATAFAAGADMLLMPEDFGKAFAAVKDAVLSGAVPAGRLDESVTRILLAKEARGLIIWK